MDVPPEALKIWDEMEQSTYVLRKQYTSESSDQPRWYINRFDAIKVIADQQAPTLEYWNYVTNKWDDVKVEPSSDHCSRIDFLFHEASTLYMAEDLTTDKTASVDKNYRPYGLDAGNVFVTGAGLFPTAGSWNRTLTSELPHSGFGWQPHT